MNDYLYVLDQQYRVLGILSNQLPNSCPYFEDIHTERLHHGFLTLEFDIPANHPSSELISSEGFICYPNEDQQFELFQIKEISEANSNGQYIKQVFTENAAVSDLLGSIIRPATLNSYTLEQIMSYILQGTGWELGRVDYSGVRDFEFEEYITSLEALHQVLDSFGAELRFRVDFTGVNINKRYVDVMVKRGENTGKIFAYSYDLIDCERIEDTKELVTALIGVGESDANGNPITFINYNPPENTRYEKHGDWVGSIEALQRWGRNGKHIFGVYEDESTNPVELYNNTVKKLDELSKPRLTYSISVVLLEKLTGYEAHKVRLGDTINVQDLTFKPPLLVNARVIEKQISKSDSSKNKVILGEFIPLFSTINPTIQRLQSVIRQNQQRWSVLADWTETDTETGETTLILKENRRIVAQENDETPISEINFRTAGFDHLDVGLLNSPSIVPRNVTDYTIYVDPADGDDSFSGDDWSNAKRTLQATFDNLPRWNDGIITIFIKDGVSWTENTVVTLEGIGGSGTIIINFQSRSTTLLSRMLVKNCQNFIHLKDGSIKNQEQFSSAVYDGSLNVSNSPLVQINNMFFDSRQGSRLQYGVLAQNSSYLLVNNDCEIYNGETSQLAAATGSRLYNLGAKGSGGAYGIYAIGPSIIGGQGNSPSGTTSTTGTTLGGVLNATFTPVSGTIPGSPPTSTKTVVFNATSTKSWRDKYNSWRSDNNNIYQGEYGGYGNHRGCIFFNSQAIQTTLSGKTVKSCRLYLERIAGGINSEQSLNLYTHNLTSPSGTPVLTLQKSGVAKYAVNDKKWISIPISAVDSIKSDTAKGVAIYSPTGSPYMIFAALAKLEITYEG